MVGKLLLAIFLLLILAVGARWLLLASSSRSPRNIVAQKEKLSPCPRRPACVSSQAQDPARRVEPIVAPGRVDVALDRAQRAIASMSGGRVVEVEGPYLRAEFTSRLFRFVDDLELLWDSSGVFHVRSASRVGSSDLGANRRRVESLRRTFENLG
jgi:uncharacterized protein (DUF1499 family)